MAASSTAADAYMNAVKNRLRSVEDNILRLLESCHERPEIHLTYLPVM